MQTKIFASLFLIFLPILAAASASAQTNNPPIRIAIEETRYVTVASARMVQSDECVQISGVLARSGKVHLPGHVDVMVLGPDGSLLDKHRIRVGGLQSNRKGRMEIPFGVELAPAIPAGSQVLIRYHAPGVSRVKC